MTGGDYEAGQQFPIGPADIRPLFDFANRWLGATQKVRKLSLRPAAVLSQSLHKGCVEVRCAIHFQPVWTEIAMIIR